MAIATRLGGPAATVSVGRGHEAFLQRIVSVMIVTSEKTIPRHCERRAKFNKRCVCLLRRNVWEGLGLLRVRKRYIFEADNSPHDWERVKKVDACYCGVIGCRRFPSPLVAQGFNEQSPLHSYQS
jgi:hypothetical protein